MSDPIEHGHIYADLLMTFGRHYLGECDPCARHALTEFIRITVVRAVENGSIEYPSLRNYFIRRFTGIGVRVSRAIGTRSVADKDMVVQAISDEVNHVLAQLVAAGRGDITPVCENYQPSQLDDCPGSVQDLTEIEQLHV
jgi:hypothetical protein